MSEDKHGRKPPHEKAAAARAVAERERDELRGLLDGLEGLTDEAAGVTVRGGKRVPIEKKTPAEPKPAKAQSAEPDILDEIWPD